MTFGEILSAIVFGFVGVIFVITFIMQMIGRMIYKNADKDVDSQWLEKSQERYPEYDNVKTYYFHLDKHTLNQGFVLEDKDHNIVYECKPWYPEITRDCEYDFHNHIINYTHHHKLSSVKTYGKGRSGPNSTSYSEITRSYFNFDGDNIFKVLNNYGYDYTFHFETLTSFGNIFKIGKTGGYTIHITKNCGLERAATLYSTYKGKNLYESVGKIVPQIGGAESYIIECNYQNLDAAILYAMAFARSQYSNENRTRSVYDGSYQTYTE